jgi:hypothetical protein
MSGSPYLARVVEVGNGGGMASDYRGSDLQIAYNGNLGG